MNDTAEIVEFNIKDQCIQIATDNLPKGCGINPTNQIEYIFSYAATNKDFKAVLMSKAPAVHAELKAQIKYICSLGLDAAKGKKLVYVKTRNVNVGDKNNKVWLKMPDISESYHALILILMRSKIIKNIIVQHTYSGYEIDYTGIVSDVPIIKSWAVTPADRGEYTGCFVTIYMPDESIQTSYHHFADIAATHQKFSKSAGTWNDHRLAMTAKSAIMDALRYIPKIDDAVQSVVEHYDDSHEFDNVYEPPYTESEKIEFDRLFNGDDSLAFWLFWQPLSVEAKTELHNSFPKKVRGSDIPGKTECKDKIRTMEANGHEVFNSYEDALLEHLNNEDSAGVLEVKHELRTAGWDLAFSKLPSDLAEKAMSYATDDAA